MSPVGHTVHQKFSLFCCQAKIKTPACIKLKLCYSNEKCLYSVWFGLRCYQPVNENNYCFKSWFFLGGGFAFKVVKVYSSAQGTQGCINYTFLAGMIRSTLMWYWPEKSRHKEMSNMATFLKPNKNDLKWNETLTVRWKGLLLPFIFRRCLVNSVGVIVMVLQHFREMKAGCDSYTEPVWMSTLFQLKSTLRMSKIWLPVIEFEFPLGVLMVKRADTAGTVSTW